MCTTDVEPLGKPHMCRAFSHTIVSHIIPVYSQDCRLNSNILFHHCWWCKFWIRFWRLAYSFPAYYHICRYWNQNHIHSIYIIIYITVVGYPGGVYYALDMYIYIYIYMYRKPLLDIPSDIMCIVYIYIVAIVIIYNYINYIRISIYV